LTAVSACCVGLCVDVSIELTALLGRLLVPVIGVRDHDSRQVSLITALVISTTTAALLSATAYRRNRFENVTFPAI